MSRSERAAGAVLAATSVLLLLFSVVGLAPRVSDLGAANERVAGAATMTLMIAGPLLATVVLLTLAPAWLLWRGRRRGRAVALVWVMAAGLFAAQALAGFGNVLWAVRAAALEPGRLLLRWPDLYWDPFLGSEVSGTPTSSLPSARLDDFGFWLPGALAIAAISVAVLLFASRGGRTGHADVPGGTHL